MRQHNCRLIPILERLAAALWLEASGDCRRSTRDIVGSPRTSSHVPCLVHTQGRTLIHLAPDAMCPQHQGKPPSQPKTDRHQSRSTDFLPRASMLSWKMGVRYRSSKMLGHPRVVRRLLHRQRRPVSLRAMAYEDALVHGPTLRMPVEMYGGVCLELQTSLACRAQETFRNE